MDPISALAGIGGALASLFGGGQPDQVLKPQAAGPGPQAQPLQSVGTQFGPAMQAPTADLFQAQAKEDAADAAQALTMQQPPFPQGMPGGLAYQPGPNGGLVPFMAAGPSPVPSQNSLAGFFAQGRTPEQAPAPEQDVLSLARNTKDQGFLGPSTPQSIENTRDVVAAEKAQGSNKAARAITGGAQAASSGSKVADSMFKNNFASTDPNQNAATSYIVGGANAGSQGASASNDFLGLSPGQWQGIGAATGILAQLFKSDPAQVLQIQQRAQQGPPPVSLNSIAMPK